MSTRTDFVPIPISIDTDLEATTTQDIMHRILFAWLALATLALLTGSAHAKACPLRTITARISRKKITAPSTAKLTVKVTNLERQGIQSSLMAVTLPANVYVIKTSARPWGNRLGNNDPVARTINSVTWSANFTEKGTRSYRFRVNITACAPDNLSFRASTYTLVNGVRSCDLDAAPAQASIVKRKADTSGCAAATGPQRFGAPGQKCADSGAQTPSGITTLDECFTYVRGCRLMLCLIRTGVPRHACSVDWFGGPTDHSYTNGPACRTPYIHPSTHPHPHTGSAPTTGRKQTYVRTSTRPFSVWVRRLLPAMRQWGHVIC